MKSSKTPQFHEWAFEQSGKNPLAWRHSAEDLIEGAKAVHEKVISFDDGMHSLAAVEAMLLGMAIECLLKAMWIKNHEAWKKVGLTDKGKLTKLKTHNMQNIAKEAKVVVSSEENELLEKLSDFIVFAGRYPIATTSEQMKPISKPSGTVVRGYISMDEMTLAYKFAGTLMEQCLPWKKNPKTVSPSA